MVNTPNTGVVALRMDARPLLTRVSPQQIRIKGTTLLRMPSRKNCGAWDKTGRRLLRRDANIRLSARAASVTRPITTVSGGNSCTSTL